MHHLNLRNVYTIGLKLLDVFEIVHEAGYVYNDLTFENMFIGRDQRPKFDEVTDYFDELSFHLWDFSTATPYKDFDTGKHLPECKVDSIMTQSNVFASANQLKF